MPRQRQPVSCRPVSNFSPLRMMAAVDVEKVDVEAERLAAYCLNDASAEDLFVECTPSHFAGSPEHETSVMEAATLATVTSPELWYTLALPERALRSVLSRAQLEAVAYACQRHESLLPSGERAGFLIGDGTGVGKGREVAAIIWENVLRGRTRAAWFTSSGPLIADAARDLADVSGNSLRAITIEQLERGMHGDQPHASRLGQGRRAQRRRLHVGSTDGPQLPTLAAEAGQAEEPRAAAAAPASGQLKPGAAPPPAGKARSRRLAERADDLGGARQRILEGVLICSYANLARNDRLLVIEQWLAGDGGGGSCGDGGGGGGGSGDGCCGDGGGDDGDSIEGGGSGPPSPPPAAGSEPAREGSALPTQSHASRCASFDGALVFDEVHVTRSGARTQMGAAIISLQARMPRARVTYCTATIGQLGAAAERDSACVCDLVGVEPKCGQRRASPTGAHGRRLLWRAQGDVGQRASSYLLARACAGVPCRASPCRTCLPGSALA